METSEEDTTPELSESLRNLGHSDLLWTRLVRKFPALLRIVPETDEADHIPQ